MFMSQMYPSLSRKQRGIVRPAAPPGVSSPVGPDSTTAGMRSAADQGQVLAQAQEPLPGQRFLQPLAQAGYAAGGFEGLVNAHDLAADASGGKVPDWYSMPEWLRRQVLDAATGGEAGRAIKDPDQA